MTIKLNKNQKKFFESAVAHFGKGSIDVRLKDINEFAEKNDLIVPTSALKQYCQEDDQTRGHYNITLSGIKYKPEYNIVPPTMEDMKADEGLIMDTPSFVEQPQKKKHKRFNPEGMKRIRVVNPVYVVSNTNGTIISVRRTITDAYDDRVLSLHDQGTKGINEVHEELDYKGETRIQSGNSQLWCDIVMMELE